MTSRNASEGKHVDCDLQNRSQRLARLAEIDALTGMANRGALDAALVNAAEDRLPTSVLLIEIDSFESYNSTYGHSAGNEAIEFIGNCLSRTISESGGFPVSCGAGRFVALLPFDEAGRALEIAAKLRSEVEARSIQHEQSSLGILSVSVGIGCRAAVGLKAVADLILAAGDALEEAKSIGPNSVCTASI